jgi:hypothetical protein
LQACRLWALRCLLRSSSRSCRSLRSRSAAALSTAPSHRFGLQTAPWSPGHQAPATKPTRPLMSYLDTCSPSGGLVTAPSTRLSWRSSVSGSNCFRGERYPSHKSLKKMEPKVVSALGALAGCLRPTAWRQRRHPGGAPAVPAGNVLAAASARPHQASPLALLPGGALDSSRRRAL